MRRRQLQGIVRVVVITSALLLMFVPASAQETPAATPAPLTMAEAERVIYGLRDALYANDLDTAMSYFAEEIEYLTRTETSELGVANSLDEVRVNNNNWLEYQGCRPLTVITGLEGNTVHAVESWTCIPDHSSFWTTLLTVKYEIEDGKIVRYEETIFDANFAIWENEQALEQELAVFIFQQNSNSRSLVDTHFADDVMMSVIYDPVLGKSRFAAGKEQVLALLAEWDEADVRYNTSPWGNRGSTLLARGTLMWPAWKDVMGVELQTQDTYEFRDGLITRIRVQPDYKMTNAYKARLEEAE